MHLIPNQADCDGLVGSNPTASAPQIPVPPPTEVPAYPQTKPRGKAGGT